jgi:hypothetical protein
MNRYHYIEIDDAFVTGATVTVVSAFAMVPSSWGNAGITPTLVATSMSTSLAAASLCELCRF